MPHGLLRRGGRQPGPQRRGRQRGRVQGAERGPVRTGPEVPPPEPSPGRHGRYWKSISSASASPPSSPGRLPAAGSSLSDGGCAYDGLVAVRDVGQQHPVGAAAVVVVHLVDLAQHALPLGLAHRGDVGARQHEVAQPLPVQRLPEAEGGGLDEPEEVRGEQRVGRGRCSAPGCRSAPRAGAPRGCARRGGSRPGPGGRRGAARGRSPAARGRGPTSGSLRADDGVDRPGAQRDPLGGSRWRPACAAAVRPGAAASRSSGSVASTRWPERRAAAGQLAGAGAELEHVGPGRGRRARSRPPPGTSDGRGRRRPRHRRTTGPGRVACCREDRPSR